MRQNNLTPFDVTPGSNKKVWWRCLKNEAHEWETYVSFRSRGRGCPHCKGGSTSSSELRVFCELKSVFPSTQHRTKINKHEVDIYIPEVRVGVEYDGEYWHRGKEKKDRKKNADLHGTLHLIRLREHGLDLIGDCDFNLSKRGIVISDLKKLLLIIKKQSKGLDRETLSRIDQYLALSTWNASPMYKKLLHEKNDVEFKNSIAHLLPDLAKEWHQSRNQPLLPDNFTPGSNKKVWWKCPKGDDHVWKASISGRAQGVGCPICSNHKIVSSNSLLFLFPKIANEWHPSKNSTSPDKIGAGSNKKSWWKCSNGDDHVWEASVAHRIRGNGCPVCSNRKAVKSNSLETLRPDLAKEWHPTKNGKTSPNDITPGSNKKVWWKCPKGEDHEWEAPVNTRNNGLGCPVCSNQKTSRSNCLAVKNPKLAKEWHPSKNGSFTPYDFTPGSGKLAWWLGKCGHEWKTSIRNRTAGKGCYLCKHIKANTTRRANKNNKKQLELVFDSPKKRKKS
ncbi:MAG: zinc-ribbon domain-containing protein [Bacteriovoracaceae bacterium]